MTPDSVPTIDLENFGDDPAAPAQLDDARVHWGFFQIIHHGVSFERLDVGGAVHRGALAGAFGADHTRFLRLNRYPPCVASQGTVALASRAHLQARERITQ